MSKNTTMEVVVHKANIPLLKSESLGKFTRALRDAGEMHVLNKLNLVQKDAAAFMIEAFADKAIFDVMKFGPNLTPADRKTRFFSTAYKRDINGNFEFGPLTEVERVIEFRETSVAVTKAKEVEVLKPFPNEHAARQADPGKFDSFRRGALPGAPAGINVIFGILTGPPRKSEIQSIRFDRTKFTVAEARQWLKDHDFKSSVEAATKKPAGGATEAKKGAHEDTKKTAGGAELEMHRVTKFSDGWKPLWSGIL